MSQMHERRGFIKQMCLAVRRDGYEVHWPVPSLVGRRSSLERQPLGCKQFGSLTISIFVVWSHNVVDFPVV